MSVAEKEFIADTYVTERDLYESTQPKENTSILRVIKGPIAEWDTLNRNKRKYSEKLWDNALSSPYVVEQLKYKTLYGEANHPVDRYEVDFSRVSHSITEMWKVPETHQIYATINILDTPLGRILNTLYEAGGVIGYSTRAGGTLIQKKGYVDVDENTYNFVTVDAVPFPSVKSARPPINEGVVEKTELSEEFHTELCKIINESNSSSREAIKDLIYSLEGYELSREIELLEGIDPKSDNKSSSDAVSTLKLLQEHSLEINGLKAENLRYKTSNEQLENEVVSLKESLKSSFETIKKLTAEGKKQQDEDFVTIGGLNDTIKEQKDRIEELEDVISERNCEIERLSNVDIALKAVQEENKGLVSESSNYKKCNEELIKTKQSLRQLETELKESYEELSSLISESASKSSEIEKLKTEINEANSNLEDAKGVIEELNKSSEVDITESANLQESVSNLTLERDDLKDEVKSLNKLNESLESRLDLIQKELISNVCSGYGLTVESVIGKLPKGFKKSDIYCVCEELSNSIGKVSYEEVITESSNLPKKETKKANRVNDFFVNRRGI